MAVFISVSTDPFDGSEARTAPNLARVRRPLRGIQIKEDTYAMLRAMTSTGEELPMFDSSSASGSGPEGRSEGGNSNFIVQNIQESRMEKQQIVETFGEDYIFFFGERPRFLQVQGVLLNTADFNWKAEFWENYDRYLRGTKLVEQNARLYFYFDDVVVEGYLVSAATTHTSQNPYHLPFNFQMYVTNYANLSAVGSNFFQQNLSGGVPSGGLVAPSAEAQRNLAASAARRGAAAGLGGFLAATASLADGSFDIQDTLDNMRNAFFTQQLIVPAGISSQLSLPPIGNKASFKPAPTNRPIPEMIDEYIGENGPSPQYDKKELLRVQMEQRLRNPLILEGVARGILATYGIDVTRREPGALLLGRAAFGGQDDYGSFGIRQADGVLNDL